MVLEAVCGLLRRSAQQLGGLRQSRVEKGAYCFGKSAYTIYLRWWGGRKCKAYCARNEVYRHDMMKPNSSVTKRQTKRIWHNYRSQAFVSSLFNSSSDKLPRTRRSSIASHSYIGDCYRHYITCYVHTDIRIQILST